jgi:hypothetical protein
MNALDLWHECRRRSITLSLNGDRLHYAGSPAAVDPMLATMKAHRDALLACVIALDGALLADGPYLPWGACLTPDRLKAWQRELFEVVDELARLEGWHDDDYDLVIGAIDRQPISTLRPDLHHFKERLDKARAAAATGRQREPR